jgi:hypothetical protein
VPEPVIARYRGTVMRQYFTGDAAFANPALQHKDRTLKRPVGRSSH